jgi:hypothetical protein
MDYFNGHPSVENVLNDALIRKLAFSSPNRSFIMVIPVAKLNLAVIEFPATSLEEPLVAKATGGRAEFEVQTSTHRATGSWSSPHCGGWPEPGVEVTFALTLSEEDRILRVVLASVHDSANVELNLGTT